LSIECGCGRRDFIRLTIGSSLAAFAPLSLALQETRTSRATRMILLWMAGAPSQLETLDPKPGCGKFQAIDTEVSGVRISEHLPKVARRMKKISLVRTVHSKDPNHDTATYLLHTGYRKAPDTSHPHFASVLANELGGRGDLPGCVVIGGSPPAGSSYLDSESGPVVFDKLENPAEDVKLAKGVSRERLEKRWKLLREFESPFVRNHESTALQERTRAYERAYRVLTSKRVSAFDVAQESDAVRAKYGRTPFGDACVIARRLLEADVRFVEVMLADWDTHTDNFNRHEKLLQTLDPAWSALVGELSDRRMLDETLVLWMGEFGRTPTVNGSEGRDHFTRAWSVALSGGGVAGARVVGETDEQGMAIRSRPVSVPDLFATVYSCFGVDPRKEFTTQGGRPIKILEGGEAVKELF